MANKKVSELTTTASAQSTDLLYLSRGATDRAITPPNFRGYADVRDYGAVGDGVTDDTAAIQAAFDSGAALVVIPAGTYLVGSTIALTNVHNGIHVFAMGATLKKGFNGNLITYSAATNIDWIGGTINGNFASYTGKCFVLSGLSTNPKWIGVNVDGFSDSYWEFGADSGHRAKLVACNGLVDTSAGQGTTGRMIHFNGPDTGARFRSFNGCVFHGYVDCDGPLDTTFSSTDVTYVDIDSSTDIFSYIGGVWGNAGGSVTCSGNNIIFAGIRFSAALTLASGSTGSFTACNFTSGGLTNSAAVSAWFIAYKAASSNDYTFNRALLNVAASVSERIQTSRSSSPGDADTTFTPATSAPVHRYAVTLTANRTITLSTTGATAGTRLRVVRSAGGAFTLDVGGLKSLAQDEWCDVEYNGTSYFLTAFGSL